MNAAAQAVTDQALERKCDRFDPGEAVVLRRESLAPNVHLLEVRAPAVAARMQPGQFINPTYLALGPDGLLYVSDEGNRRLQVFRLLPPLGAAPTTPTP